MKYWSIILAVVNLTNEILEYLILAVNSTNEILEYLNTCSNFDK